MKVFLGSKKKKKTEKLSLRTLSVLSFICGAALVAFNFFMFSSMPQIYTILNIVSAFIILGVPLIYKYSDYRDIRVVEAMFPVYLRDIAENISTGMTLPQAMRATQSNDYGVFTPYAKELSAKVSWGIPLEQALQDFAKKTKSKSMKRNVQTISEAYHSGGTVATILSSVAQSLQELERIKKERAASIYAQMVNGYLIYIIFLGVMIGLSSILVPAFVRFGGGTEDLQGAFVEIFRSLTVIQGFFAGIAIGKMAEGTIVAGLKHAIVMVIFGYTALVIFA